MGGDLGYATRDFVAGARGLGFAPHLAQGRGPPVLDGRTTRHPGYAVSQRHRKRVEESFGWVKTVGGLRKLKHRGLALVDAIFTWTMAVYDLVRLRTLLAGSPA